MDLRALQLAFPAFAAANLRVRSKESGFVPLKANRIQRFVHAAQIGSQRTRFYELKFRQGGLTTWHGCEDMFLCVAVDGFNCAILTHTGEHAVKLHRLLKGVWERIPKPTKAALPDMTSWDEDVGFTWSNGSSLYIATASGTERGRGDTIHRAHLSEFAFWEQPEKQLAALEGAMPPGGHITIETTPNGFNHAHALWTENKGRIDSQWELLFMPWWLQEEYRLPAPANFKPTPAEAALIAAHDLRPEQIMFRRQRQGALKALFLQEFPEDDLSCWVGTGDSVWDAEAVAALSASCRPPVRVFHGGALRVWYDAVPGRAYVIGADCAEGVPDGDLNAAAVLNARSGEHVATLMCNPAMRDSRQGRMDTTLYAARLAALGYAYNTAMIAVEVNGSAGGAVLSQLVNVHRYPNLYCHNPSDWFAGNGDTAGFRTTPASKSALVTDFRSILEAREFSTYDERLPQQMADFIVYARNGVSGAEKLGARAGSHDDLMMAALVADHARIAALRASIGGRGVTTLAGVAAGEHEEGFEL